MLQLGPSAFHLRNAQLAGGKAHANGDWDSPLRGFQCDAQDTIRVQPKLPTSTIGPADSGHVCPGRS